MIPRVLCRFGWTLCCCLLACGVSDEARIRALVDGAVDAARDGDLQSVAEPVSADYLDARSLNRQSLLGLVAAYLRAAENLHFLAQTRDVRVGDDDRAQATLLLAIADIPIDLDALDRISADLLWIDLSLARESGEWKLIAADWRAASTKDFLIP